MRLDILSEFNLKPFILANNTNKKEELINEDFVDIEPYQISCLYGADRLSVNFIYILQKFNTKKYSIYEVLISRLKLKSIKLELLRYIYHITNLYKVKPNKHRIKLRQYFREKFNLKI